MGRALAGVVVLVDEGHAGLRHRRGMYPNKRSFVKEKTSWDGAAVRLVALDEAVLVDAPPDAIAAAVAGDAVLQHGAAHPDRAVGDDLLADDVVLAAVLVGDARVDADLARAALDGARLDLELLEREQLLAVPQAADADVELLAEVDADRVEPEVGAELAGEVRPAVELRPVALAAPGVVAVADAVERRTRVPPSVTVPVTRPPCSMWPGNSSLGGVGYL